MDSQLEALFAPAPLDDETPRSSVGKYVTRAAHDYRAASACKRRLQFGRRSGYRPEDGAPETARLHEGRMRRLVEDLLRGTVSLEALREECRDIGELV